MASTQEKGCTPVPNMKQSSLPHDLRTLKESAVRAKFDSELFMRKLNLLVFQYSQGFGEILCEGEHEMHDEVISDIAAEMDDEISRYIVKLMDFKFKLKNVSVEQEPVPGNSDFLDSVNDEELVTTGEDVKHQRSKDTFKDETDNGMSADQISMDLESVPNPELISIYTDSDVDLTALDMDDGEVTSVAEDLCSNVEEPGGDSMTIESEGRAEEARKKCQEPVCSDSEVSDDGTEVLGGSPTKQMSTAEVDCAKNSTEDQPNEAADFNPDGLCGVMQNPKKLIEQLRLSVSSSNCIGNSSSGEFYHTAVLMDTEKLPRTHLSSGEYFYTAVENQPEIRPRSPSVSQPADDVIGECTLGNDGGDMCPKSSSSAGKQPESMNEAANQVKLPENNKNPRIYDPDEIQVRVERIPQYILDYIEEYGCIWCPDGISDEEMIENDDDLVLEKELRRLKLVIAQNGLRKDSSRATHRNGIVRIKTNKCKTRSNSEDITRASSSESEDEDERDTQCLPTMDNEVITVHGGERSESSSEDSGDSRGGELSSDEDDMDARRNVLRGLNGPNERRRKGPSSGVQSIYTPRINLRFPMESDSDDDTRQGRITCNRAGDSQLDGEEQMPSANELVTVACSDSDSSSLPPKLPALRMSRKRKRQISGSSNSSSRADSSSDECAKRQRKKRLGNGNSELKKMILHDKTESIHDKTECSDDKSESSDEKSESNDCDNAQDSEEDTERGRKNIRPIMAASKSALDAELAEQKRKKRISERQALFNEEFQMPEHQVLDKLILDAHLETKERLVEVDRKLVKNLKPHQAEGVRFMWDSCFESVEKIRECPEGDGGCILAHCMGLGKTLQVVTLLHSIMSSPKLNITTALVICPLNTATNWCNELEKWTRDLDKPLVIHEVYAEVTTRGRSKVLQAWQEDGGVCVIHYDLFRNLLHGKRVNEEIKSVVERCLLDPGPDVVVCDEGHLVKNDKASVTHVLNRIKTKRRIILTGTPLQNNLMEYYCMVQFVKPGLLGSKAEFANRFVNPIENGQHSNSDVDDVKLMKDRAAVLYRLLHGCVQRRDFSILEPYLPPKYEYAIKIHMSQVQEKLYCHYLKSIKTFHTKKALKMSFLKHVNYLVQILCHPKALEYMHDRRRSRSVRNPTAPDPEFLREMVQLLESVRPSSSSESGRGEIESERASDGDASSNTQACQEKESAVFSGSDDEHSSTTTDLYARCTNATEKEEEIHFDPDIETGQKWWNKFFDEDGGMDDIYLSCKMTVLFEILKLCESIGDKVLVFSQYKYTLDLIEYFLKDLDAQVVREHIDDTKNSRKRWRKNIEYFRIDGSTAPKKRQKGCHKFNEKTANSRAKLFLISTKAGGLGINLVGANRVVIFDPSWNPSNDVQSIFRAYRFGQTKPCYVYRLLARGTVEEKMYARQVVKLSLAGRVVDQHQIKRHHTAEDIVVMFQYEPASYTDTPVMPEDKLLADLLSNFTRIISSYVKHDALLENQVDQVLTEDEKLEAWINYLQERGKVNLDAISSDGKSNQDSDESRPGDETTQMPSRSCKEDSDDDDSSDGDETTRMPSRSCKEDSADDDSDGDETTRMPSRSCKEDSEDDDSDEAKDSSSSDSD